MKLSDDTIDKIKSAMRIEEVVADFIDLRRKGVEYTGLCPFHDDRNEGNFKVSPAKGIYKCFSCGAQGNAIDFVMAYQHCSFPEACEYIGRKYHIILEDGTENMHIAKRPKPAPRPVLMLPRQMVQARMLRPDDDDTLVKWLLTIKWDSVQRSRIGKVLREYLYGHTRDGMSLFWQVDELGHVRTGKMMRYSPTATDARIRDTTWTGCTRYSPATVTSSTSTPSART